MSITDDILSPLPDQQVIACPGPYHTVTCKLT